MKKILILHGPNLNMLGQREPHIYGNMSLKSINRELIKYALKFNVILDIFQSNYEGDIIGYIHSVKFASINFIIINPAAYTHTSVAILDAIVNTRISFIEVHISNIYKRESFRKYSYFSEKANGVICGLGWIGYLYALKYVLRCI